MCNPVILTLHFDFCFLSSIRKGDRTYIFAKNWKMFAKCSDCTAIGNKHVSYYVHRLDFNRYFLRGKKKTRAFKAATGEISILRICNKSYWDKILISAKLWIACWYPCLLIFHPSALLRQRAKGQILQVCLWQCSCLHKWESWQDRGKGFSRFVSKTVTCEEMTPNDTNLFAKYCTSWHYLLRYLSFRYILLTCLRKKCEV